MKIIAIMIKIARIIIIKKRAATRTIITFVNKILAHIN